MIKVSVIVPVYNVEPYLCRCLESLVHQTLKDIEIICVNDCSTDNCLAILKDYAKKDKRIKIINFKKNQGVSTARNTGIKMANGEYIGIVDSDDYVDLDYYEKLYSKAMEKKYNIVHANIKYQYPKGYMSLSLVKRFRKVLIYPAHWSAIYKTDFLRLHSLKYPIGIKNYFYYSEDHLFFVQAQYFANGSEFVADTYYYYVQRENSAGSNMENMYESTALPLIFDFINDKYSNKEEYRHLIGFFFRFIIIDTIMRIKPEHRLKAAQFAVDMYKNRRFKVSIPGIPNFIQENDWENAETLLKKIINDFAKPYDNIKIENLQNRKLYIWGTGVDGPKAQMQCESNNWKISAFLDSNKNVKEFKGYKVKRPEQVLNKAKNDFFIIIASRKYGKEIAKVCRNAGLKMGKDFWRPL